MEKEYKQTNIILIVLLVLNILLGIYIAFFKHDALWLETLKAGGRENMQIAKQLYQSDIYIQQQKSVLEQIIGSINQPTVNNQPAVTDTTASGVVQ